MTTTDVLEPATVRWASPDAYPNDVEAGLNAVGPGVADLVSTSTTWPGASASVSIQVFA